jgi:ParB family chromosome partitioning protein
MKLSKAEFEAVIQASQRTFVSFSHLVLSVECQARTPGGTPRLSIPELAASIKECGVLQNLIVVQTGRNTYEVCAGGRRLEALTTLVAAGELPENYLVPVLIVAADRGLIASLAENAFHLPMHPADEFEAFAKLVARGKPVEDVAAAFGVTPMVVKRRMKLAAVSPRLMAQFRESSINLECLMVLASVEDHERQEQAWAGLDSWNRHPDHLRRILTQGEVESDRSPVAKYVTVKAYEKAGGPTRRDLFSDSDKKVYLLDAALLDQLAVGKLQRKAKKIVAEGWKWVDVRPRYVHDEYVRHGELRKPCRAPGTEEAEALSQLQAQLTEHSQRLDELYDQDDVDEAEISRLDALCTSVTAQMETIQEALTVWPPDLMAQAGCLVYVGNDAQPAVRFGLVRPEDRDRLIQAGRNSCVAGGDAGTALACMPAPKTRPVHSEKLVRNLTAHRVAAIQAELLDRSDVALAVLTAQMAKSLLLDDYRQAYGCEDPLSLRVEDAHGGLRSDAQDMESGKAWQILQTKRSHWQSVLPTQAAGMLPWVLAQHPDTVRQLFTFLVAITVTGVYGTEPGQQRTDGIARALNLDMTKWWEATGPSYFQHVSKARATEVVSEAGDVQAGTAMQPLKKDAAVAYAERAVAGRGWLPPILCVRAIGDQSPSCETSDALRAPHAPADAPHADIEESQESAAGGEDRAPWDEQPQEGQALAS